MEYTTCARARDIRDAAMRIDSLASELDSGTDHRQAWLQSVKDRLATIEADLTQARFGRGMAGEASAPSTPLARAGMTELQKQAFERGNS